MSRASISHLVVFTILNWSRKLHGANVLIAVLSGPAHTLHLFFEATRLLLVKLRHEIGTAWSGKALWFAFYFNIGVTLMTFSAFFAIATAIAAATTT